MVDKTTNYVLLENDDPESQSSDNSEDEMTMSTDRNDTEDARDQFVKEDDNTAKSFKSSGKKAAISYKRKKATKGHTLRKWELPPQKETPLAAVFWFPVYIACSVGMVLLNKTLSVEFGNPNTILGLQNGATVFYLCLGGTIGLFDLSVPFRLSQFRPFLAPTINWVIMLALSLKMLQYNSVATMTMFKTVGTLLTCAIEILYFKVTFSNRAKASLGLLALGSAVYAGTDVGFSAIGYFYASLQITSWVLQTFIEKVTIVDSEQTKAGITVIRNILSLPVVYVLVAISGEMKAMSELMTRQEIWGQVLLSSLFGCGLGLATSALYKYFAPTTVVVANNAGKCITIYLGCLLFKDTLSTLQLIGLATSLTGGFFYGQEEKKRLAAASNKA